MPFKNCAEYTWKNTTIIKWLKSDTINFSINGKKRTLDCFHACIDNENVMNVTRTWRMYNERSLQFQTYWGCASEANYNCRTNVSIGTAIFGTIKTMTGSFPLVIRYSRPVFKCRNFVLSPNPDKSILSIPLSFNLFAILGDKWSLCAFIK